jgi:hypothetical protein
MVGLTMVVLFIFLSWGVDSCDELLILYGPLTDRKIARWTQDSIWILRPLLLHSHLPPGINAHSNLVLVMHPDMMIWLTLFSKAMKCPQFRTKSHQNEWHMVYGSRHWDLGNNCAPLVDTIPNIVMLGAGGWTFTATNVALFTWDPIALARGKTQKRKSSRPFLAMERVLWLWAEIIMWASICQTKIVIEKLHT